MTAASNKLIYKVYINCCNFFNLFLGFDKIVQLLIEKGANVNAVNKVENSALIYAATKGSFPDYWL